MIAKYAGMEVLDISTWEDEVSGVGGTKSQHLSGAGGAPPPSTLPANAPTEPIQLMLTPIGPDLLPGMTITAFMSVQIIEDFRYMNMKVATVNTRTRRVREGDMGSSG